MERVPTGTGLRWGLILGIVLSIPLVVFLAQNTQSVTINFLDWTGQVPLVAVLGVTVIATIVIVELIGLAVRCAGGRPSWNVRSWNGSAQFRRAQPLRRRRVSRYQGAPLT